MIISDLSHLEDLPAAPSVTGGFQVGASFPRVQINSALVLQKSTALSTALTYSGDAIAISTAVNDSLLNQLIK